MECLPSHNFDSCYICKVKTYPSKIIEKYIVFFCSERVKLTNNKRVYSKFKIAQLWDGDLYNIDEVTIFSTNCVPLQWLSN